MRQYESLQISEMTALELPQSETQQVICDNDSSADNSQQHKPLQLLTSCYYLCW